MILSLINFYKFDGNGKDYNGVGPTNSVGYTVFNGETVGYSAAYINLTPMKSDFTLSFDMYRYTLVADWSTDYGIGNVSWGTGFGAEAGLFCVGYWQGYGYPNLILIKNWGENHGDLKTPRSETINKWLHIEIHRKEKQYDILYDGVTKLIWTDSQIPTVNHIYFYNAGSNQTGGGYFKNIRIYDNYYEESMECLHKLYNLKDNMYGNR